MFVARIASVAQRRHPAGGRPRASARDPRGSPRSPASATGQRLELGAAASRASAASRSGRRQLPFSTLRARKPAMRSRPAPRPRRPGRGPRTAIPASAATWAMPAPIVPAPSTPSGGHRARRHRPSKRGSRFSANAATPSAWSAVRPATSWSAASVGEALVERRVLGGVHERAWRGPIARVGACGQRARQLAGRDASSSPGTTRATSPAVCRLGRAERLAAGAGSPPRGGGRARGRGSASSPESGTSPMRPKAGTKRASSPPRRGRRRGRGSCPHRRRRR